jgi:transitional endoplasmic reticulum ATPase
MKLTVKQINEASVNRGLAAFPSHVLKKLEVTNGDYVLIENNNDEVGARVWPTQREDDNDNVVRIDSTLRNQLNVNIGDRVQVDSEVEFEPAERIELVIPEGYEINGLEKFIRETASKFPVMRGSELTIPVSTVLQKQEIKLIVSDTEPTDYVFIQDTTKIDITQKSGYDAPSQKNTVSYDDIGGLEDELEQVREMIEIPMEHPELFDRLGIEPPSGVLLHGPPGTGKTMIAKAVANEIDASFHTINGPEIISKYYGESEEKLREKFEEATEEAPAVIFFDEIDSIGTKREDNSGDVERRVVAQLLALMDGLEERDQVTVIGATNRIDAIDNALRRGGRFDREIEVGVPNEKGRREILDVHTRNMPLSEGVDLDQYAESTHGFVGADIESLSKEAAMTALRRIRPNIDLEEDEIGREILMEMNITDDDFRQALRDIEPSALREVFVEVPDIEWNDIGGVEESKNELRKAIQWPLRETELFEKLNIESTKGVLLYGPPGTGKTLLAKAVANESESNFISVKGPELLSRFVGESEKGVRDIFKKARENAPTVIFFDEIDSIANQRGGNMSDGGVSQRVVSQLLTELDGLEKLQDVVVVATTNRPDLIDDALIRPGRLDNHVHVPVPAHDARKAIFDVHLDSKPTSGPIDLEKLADMSDGFVGADIAAACRKASLLVAEEEMSKQEQSENPQIEMRHIESALDEITPSVDDETIDKYEKIEESFGKKELEDTETRSAFR